MPLTRETFDQGMTTQEYFDQIKINKQPITAIYNAAETPSSDKRFFDNLSEPLLLAVFTADWCGDAMSTTPVILKLGSDTTNLDIKVFDRDKELDLTNSFLPPNRAGTVPVFVVLDSHMHEISRFIETAKGLIPTLDKMEQEVGKATIASEDRGKPMNEISEASRTDFRSRRTSYRVEHACDWGYIICHEFTELVKAGLALMPENRPSEGGTEWPPL